MATKPRRKTYVVKLAGISKPKRILTYAPQDAVTYYNKRGYRVESVELEGDKPQQFTVSTLALRQAIKFLGIKYPVEVKLSARKGGRYGAHKPCLTGAKHIITLKTYLDPDHASEVLWHELTHALQNERDMRPDEISLRPARARRMSAEKGMYKYAPSEIEANANMKLAAQLPLVRPL